MHYHPIRMLAICDPALLILFNADLLCPSRWPDLANICTIA
jgi:hypothetical protein